MLSPFKIGDIVTFLMHPHISIEILRVHKPAGKYQEYDYIVLQNDRVPDHIGRRISYRSIDCYGPIIKDNRTKLSKTINDAYEKVVSGQT